MNDKELIEGLRKGDKGIFEQLFRKYIITLREYALFYVNDKQIAEDMVQDLFLKIWEKRETIVIHTSLKAYLYRSTHNICIQYLRCKSVSQKHQEFVKHRLNEAKLMNQLYFESGLSNLFEKEISEQVNVSLDKLSPKTLEVITLSRKKHLKNSEIAKKINLTEKSVEYHITKALKLLREDLKDYLLIILILLLK